MDQPLPILPTWVPEQAAHYQGGLLLRHPVIPFDPHVAARHHAERPVLAIDLGGDKLRHALYRPVNGVLQPGPESTHQATGGTGYLERLEHLAAEASAQNLAIGISAAIRLEGTIATRSVNLPVFLDAFRTRYGADFDALFGGRATVVNDTIAGICGAATHLARRGHPFRHVMFAICASGLGGAVIANGIATHVEIAHVPLVDALNPLGQTTSCGVEGREFVCVERVTATRAGIENLYTRLTGERGDGYVLGARYAAGDPLATILYRTSALALSHAIAGVLERYAFVPGETAVILHGGTFEVAPYRAELERCLAHLPVASPAAIYARDLSPNTCLDGAAILASTRSTR